jgi:hypothetical protein
VARNARGGAFGAGIGLNDNAAFKTANALQALADSQRDWLVKLRKERGSLSAVEVAGPFIMSSQGKL